MAGRTSGSKQSNGPICLRAVPHRRENGLERGKQDRKTFTFKIIDNHGWEDDEKFHSLDDALKKLIHHRRNAHPEAIVVNTD